MNFGTTRGTFLYFFFAGYIQLRSIKAAAHKGVICLIILALTEVCAEDLDSQQLLVWCQCTRVCQWTCVCSFTSVVDLNTCSYNHFNVFISLYVFRDRAKFWKRPKQETVIRLIRFQILLFIVRRPKRRLVQREQRSVAPKLNYVSTKGKS